VTPLHERQRNARKYVINQLLEHVEHLRRPRFKEYENPESGRLVSFFEQEDLDEAILDVKHIIESLKNW
jgi:hypothetical protein